MEQFRRADVSNSPDTRIGLVTSGGVARSAIFQHPSPPNAPAASIVYPTWRAPAAREVSGLMFRAAIGFRDGAAFKAADSNGCDFVVLVDGKSRLRETHTAQQWRPIELDLSSHLGKPIQITLQVFPRGDSAADWAAWADPQLVFRDPSDQLVKQLKTASDVPSRWRVAELRQEFHSKLGVLGAESAAGGKPSNTWIGTLDVELDLAAALECHPVTSPVPLGPRIVVGEGKNEDNHTIVRVLNPHGVVESQFLAFPPSVRGGVQVECLRDAEGQTLIAATPHAELGLVRIFDLRGGLVRQIFPLNRQCALDIASGDFIEESPGDELAITDGTAMCQILSVRGALLRNAGGSKTDIQLIAKQRADLPTDDLIGFNKEERWASSMMRAESSRTERFRLLPASVQAFGNGFSDDTLWVGDSRRGLIYALNERGNFRTLPVGREEERFWIALPDEFEQTFGRLKNRDAAKFVRLCNYGHIRVDAMSPNYRQPKAGVAMEARIEAMENAIKEQGFHTPLVLQDRMMWNPCTTHRQLGPLFQAWANTQTSGGRPAHMMQSPSGLVDGHRMGADAQGLISSTYAESDRSLQERLVVEPLRTFLRGWTPLFRADPALVPSLEPNHEHEIAVASEKSIGDYNDEMIRGFYHWLAQRYGNQPQLWSGPLGVEYGAHFDAPRGLGRGDWDRFTADNPLFMEWVEYNRHAVNRMLALTYREALLAGAPPDIIHCHQIPDRFAVAPVIPAVEGVTRISPIDYAMTAGVNFGFTRFGVQHVAESSAAEAASSSGFPSYVMGEFQPLTKDAQVAGDELRYLHEQGAKAIHVLYWGEKHRQAEQGGDAEATPESKQAGMQDREMNRAIYQAVQSMLLEDAPRKVVGGVVGVRAAKTSLDHPQGGKSINIVGLTMGDSTLLKSVDRDGRMEGSVYVTPFRQRIKVAPLLMDQVRENGFGNRTTTRTVPVNLSPGAQIDIDLFAESEQPQSLRFFVEQHGMTLPEFSAEFQIDEHRRHYRFQLRSPERNDAITIRIVANTELDFLTATVQSPQFADIHAGRKLGVAHRGPVSFDVAP